MLLVISLLGCCRKDGTSSNGKKFRITGLAPIFRRERFHDLFLRGDEATDKSLLFFNDHL